jgi:hypothetical protein
VVPGGPPQWKLFVTLSHPTPDQRIGFDRRSIVRTLITSCSRSRVAFGQNF